SGYPIHELSVWKRLDNIKAVVDATDYVKMPVRHGQLRIGCASGLFEGLAYIPALSRARIPRVEPCEIASDPASLIINNPLPGRSRITRGMLQIPELVARCEDRYCVRPFPEEIFCLNPRTYRGKTVARGTDSHSRRRGQIGHCAYDRIT